MRIFILDKVMTMINSIIYIIYALFFTLLDCIIICYFCLLFWFKITFLLKVMQYLIQFCSIQEFILLILWNYKMPDPYLYFQNLTYHYNTSAHINYIHTSS